MNETTLQSILQNGELIEELSDGQFTGGIYSQKWRYNDTDYELWFDEDGAFEFQVYKSPEQYQQEIAAMVKTWIEAGNKLE